MNIAVRAGLIQHLEKTRERISQVRMDWKLNHIWEIGWYNKYSIFDHSDFPIPQYWRKLEELMETTFVDIKNEVHLRVGIEKALDKLNNEYDD